MCVFNEWRCRTDTVDTILLTIIVYGQRLWYANDAVHHKWLKWWCEKLQILATQRVTRREPLNGLNNKSVYMRAYKHFCAYLAKYILQQKHFLNKSWKKNMIVNSALWKQITNVHIYACTRHTEIVRIPKEQIIHKGERSLKIYDTCLTLMG